MGMKNRYYVLATAMWVTRGCRYLRLKAWVETQSSSFDMYGEFIGCPLPLMKMSHETIMKLTFPWVWPIRYVISHRRLGHLYWSCIVVSINVCNDTTTVRATCPWLIFISCQYVDIQIVGTSWRFWRPAFLPIWRYNGPGGMHRSRRYYCDPSWPIFDC